MRGKFYASTWTALGFVLMFMAEQYFMLIKKQKLGKHNSHETESRFNHTAQICDSD